METSLVSNAVSVAASQGLGFSKFLLPRHDFTSYSQFSLYDSSSEQSSFARGLQISAAIFPVDTVAPPLVKSNYLKAAPRRLVRKTRRTRRRSLTGGGAEDGEDGGLFGDDGDGDGPFGGGRSGGGGGGGWNFDRFGWSNRDESSSAWPSDPAFDFVYEVICWISLSNCLHFAFKRVLRIVADGVGDPAREKVPMRLSSIC